MQAVFRVDASVDIGSGHFMRSLSLAKAMVSAGVQCRFVCRDLPGHMAEHVRSRKIDVVMLPLLAPYKKPESSDDYAGWLQVDQAQDADEFVANLPAKCDLVVVDHYGLDKVWESKVIDHCDQLVAIDDLCRSHIADVLIDQTFGRDQTAYKASKVKFVLAGQQYALLWPKYYRYHEACIRRQMPNRHRLLVSMGGYDTLNMTGAVLDLLAAAPPEWLERVDVVLTAAAPHYEEVRRKIERRGAPLVLHDFVQDFGGLMMGSTMAIGAAGTTTWERAALGLPSILVPVAENQAAVAAAMREAKTAIVIEPEDLSRQFDAAILSLRDHWHEFVRANLLVTDGLGCRRVLQRLLPLLSEDNVPVWLDVATEVDTRQVYEWQQAPETRRHARNPESPVWAEHEQWMQASLRDPECYFYMLRKAGVAVGVVRLNWLRASEYEVSIIVAPSLYGQGLGLNALKLLRQLHQEITIHATVLPGDTASLRLFAAAGYEQASDTEFVLSGK